MRGDGEASVFEGGSRSVGSFFGYFVGRLGTGAG